MGADRHWQNLEQQKTISHKQWNAWLFLHSTITISKPAYNIDVVSNGRFCAWININQHTVAYLTAAKKGHEPRKQDCTIIGLYTMLPCSFNLSTTQCEGYHSSLLKARTSSEPLCHPQVCHSPVAQHCTSPQADRS